MINFEKIEYPNIKNLDLGKCEKFYDDLKRIYNPMESIKLFIDLVKQINQELVENYDKN